VTTSISQRIADELGVRERQVTAAVELLDQPVRPTALVGFNDKAAVGAMTAAREMEGYDVVVVTHNRQLASRADRVLSLEGGRLVPLSGVESMP